MHRMRAVAMFEVRKTIAFSTKASGSDIYIMNETTIYASGYALAGRNLEEP